jgi:hypothetical protein
MRILGTIPPPQKAEHERARIWGASALAALALLMLMLLIGSPPPEDADLMPPQLRAARITSFLHDAAACRAALRGAGFEVERLPDLRENGQCGYDDAFCMEGDCPRCHCNEH